jgi:hypothetical protein
MENGGAAAAFRVKGLAPNEVPDGCGGAGPALVLGAAAADEEANADEPKGALLPKVKLVRLAAELAVAGSTGVTAAEVEGCDTADFNSTEGAGAAVGCSGFFAAASAAAFCVVVPFAGD